MALPFEILAAIDLGSNSFHMLVAKVNEPNQLLKLNSLRESVRLGQGLDHEQNLTLQVQKRALKCLIRFQEHIQYLPKAAIRVAGTNTLRTAKNAHEFITKAESILGCPIEVLSGLEEARLIYMGIANGHPPQEGKRLVIDIGGGSTELIIGEGADLHVAKSLSMGCVSLSSQFFPGGELTNEHFERAISNAKESIQPAFSSIDGEQWKHVIGCSGSIKAIRKIARSQGWTDTQITLSGLHKLKDAMILSGHIDTLDFEVLKKSRRPVLAGGLSALIALFEQFELQGMEVSKQALREGLLYDLIQRTKDD